MHPFAQIFYLLLGWSRAPAPPIICEKPSSSFWLTHHFLVNIFPIGSDWRSSSSLVALQKRYEDIPVLGQRPSEEWSPPMGGPSSSSPVASPCFKLLLFLRCDLIKTRALLLRRAPMHGEASCIFFFYWRTSLGLDIFLSIDLRWLRTGQHRVLTSFENSWSFCGSPHRDPFDLCWICWPRWADFWVFGLMSSLSGERTNPWRSKPLEAPCSSCFKICGRNAVHLWKKFDTRINTLQGAANPHVW